MRPVLEQLALAPAGAAALAVAVEGEPVERLARVGAEAREGRQVVGAGEDVYRVELQQADVADQPAQVARVDPAARAGAGEALRRQRRRPRLPQAQLDVRALQRPTRAAR